MSIGLLAGVYFDVVEQLQVGNVCSKFDAFVRYDFVSMIAWWHSRTESDGLYSSESDFVVLNLRVHLQSFDILYVIKLSFYLLAVVQLPSPYS